MCTIIGMKFKNHKQKVTLNQFMKLALQIKVKGFDEFGYVFVFNDRKNFTHNYLMKTGIKSYKKFKEMIAYDFINNESRIKSVLIHSRATPEMETDTEIPQPYVVNNQHTIKPYVLAAHGTIPDYSEITNEYLESLTNSKMNRRKLSYILDQTDKLTVDTEYLSLTNVLAKKIISETKGKLTTIALDLTNGEFYHELMSNKLGIWKHTFYNSIEVFANLNIKNQMILDESNVAGLNETSFNSRQYSFLENKLRHTKEVFVSFSGGMDIVASLLKYLNHLYVELPKYVIENRKIHVTLTYFDWGQNAKDIEVKTMRKFKKFLIKQYPEIYFHTKVIYLQEVFKLFGDLRLSNKDTVGNSLETEQSISYVNFRNSIFLNILAGYAEKIITDKYGEAIPVDFIFGLNLSEGMIMSDNSYLWLENINKSIRCSGDYSQQFMVVAPFVHNTKTEIMQYLLSKPKLKEALEISFSCYYPGENNEPCGKCGSCILRETAFNKVQQFKKKG